jgi:hypothetical protein
MADPVIVNPSPLGPQLRSGLRALLLLGGSFGFLSRFLTPEQIAFIQSDDFLGAVSTILTVGSIAWAQIEARLNKMKLVDAAQAAPDTKFIVQESAK